MQSDHYTKFQKSEPTQADTSEGVALKELIDAMCMVDLSDPEAALNASTISDGKGGRILL